MRRSTDPPSLPRRAHLAAPLALALALALACGVSGCDTTEPAPPMALEAFCADANKPPMTGDMRGARSQIEGYVLMPSLFVMCDTTCMFQIAADPEGKGQKVGGSFRVGSGGNRMDRPKKDFTAADVEIRTHDGRRVDLSRPVRVSGARLGSDAKSCVISVDHVAQ